MSAILSDRAVRYALTPKAVDDLDAIWRYTAETWSLGQADEYIDALVAAFEMLVAMPLLARERNEFTPPVRIHRHAMHLIVYMLGGEVVTIIRVLGGRQDWQALLEVPEQ